MRPAAADFWGHRLSENGRDAVKRAIGAYSWRIGPGNGVYAKLGEVDIKGPARPMEVSGGAGRRRGAGIPRSRCTPAALGAGNDIDTLHSFFNTSSYA